MNKYFVHYVENCSPKLKSFTSKEKVNSFIKKISKKRPEDGYWVDFIFKGDIVSIDEYYKTFLRNKRK